MEPLFVVHLIDDAPAPDGQAAYFYSSSFVLVLQIDSAVFLCRGTVDPLDTFDELCDGLAVYDVAFPQIIGVAIELKFYPVVKSFLSSQYRDSTNLVVPDLLRFIATAVEISFCVAH